MPKLDLTGKKSEFFEVVDRNYEKKGKNAYWNCQCQCGKIFTATATDINKGKVKSCGCMSKILSSRAHLQDITGQHFGELVVIERDFDYPQNGKKPRTYWKCKCSCGNVISIERTHLVNRNKISCGCKNSIGEYNINNLLSNNNIKYKSQYTNGDLISENKGYFKFDFAILDDNNNVIRLIEFDGPQHNIQSSVPDYFNQEEIIKRDIAKNNYAKEKGIPLVRIPYHKRDTLILDDLLGDKFLI